MVGSSSSRRGSSRSGDNMTSRAIAAVGVLLACAALARAAQFPGTPVLSRPADGFSVVVPGGWAEGADADGTAAIVQTAQSDVMVIFFVQREAAPGAVTDVLARAVVKLKNDTTRRLISSKFDVLLDRPVLIAVLEDATVRYKLTVVPRDEGDNSQIYYGVMAAAPRQVFAKVEAALDRIVAGFTTVPLEPRASGPGREGPAGSAIDHAKVLERILAPWPTK